MIIKSKNNRREIKIRNQDQSCVSPKTDSKGKYRKSTSEKIPTQKEYHQTYIFPEITPPPPHP